MDTPHAATPSTTSDDTNEITPYRPVVSNLVAGMIALAQQVLDRRPEARNFGGSLAMSIHAATGTIIFGLERQDGTAVVIERIDCDPASTLFGASALPIATPKGMAH